MNNLPVGTVTFLFSDIEGNTPLWERDPVKMDAAMQIHHTILRQAIEANGGVVFKVIGDEFQAAFPTAPQALLAALEAQRGLHSAAWNELGPLRVRMGMHTGEAHLDAQGDEYAVSHTKNRGHRVMEAGHGGQILLSQESAELCQRSLPEAVTLKDLGEHHIRNWKLPEHFYQVVATDLPRNFPPLRTQAEPKHNLPAQLTSFIGRKQEIRQVENLLKKNRLVTLTGPGGTGKTRLALQVATELLGRYPDGAWMVELSPLTDPEKVPMAFLRGLGLREKTGSEALSLLEDFLSAKKLLLVLDNCEHLIDACALLADDLLHACPQLRMIASSREALGIEGETSFRVPPLTFPKLDEPLENLAHYEAIRLFIERASTASPGFALTAANASAIIQVCQRLDGIPLAIELSAARVKLLQVEEIAQRLDDRFRLLTGGSRAALPRYQTLRASIDWSYELLSPAERILLQRLSVFAGSWTLEAAEFVGCGEDIESCAVLDLLGQLVNKSLVSIETGILPGSRYRMLETIRQYAHEKLVEAGSAEQARDHHLQYLIELAEKVSWKIRGPNQAAILDYLEAELDNLRLALAWSLERKGKPGWDPKPGLRLASALLWFWHCRGRQEEGLEWLESLLAAKAEGTGEKQASLDQVKIRAWALRVAGYLAYLNDNRKAAALSEESRDLFASLGSDGKWGYAYAQINLANIARNQGNPLQANALYEESLVLFQETGDQFAIAECIWEQGSTAYLYQPEQARRYLEKNLAIRREIGDQDGAASSLWLLGGLVARQQEFGKARQLWEESRRLFLEAKNTSAIAFVISDLGYLNWMEGNYTQAARDFDEILLTGRFGGDPLAISTGLEALGRLVLSQGDNDRAAKLLEEYLSFGRKKESKLIIMNSLNNLGHLAWIQNDIPLAVKRYSEALEIYRNLGNPIAEAMILCSLGKTSLTGGNFESAREYFAKAIKIIPVRYWYFGFSVGILLEGIAFLAIIQHQAQRAASLLGSTQAWHEQDFFKRFPKERQERENASASLREKMGEEAFSAAWEEGKAMTLEQAIAYAEEVTHV